ncbi:MAG: tRNA(His) guanylyltransferase Thg1 family protein [Smithella sp.]|nr:tRNA(His) guanylyltransferase Thg1 family protein [Smithella sp.]MDD5674369.1 tRNA(His) guanylyltransferase Thg1 family protein [Chitinivibrionales bacterium]
MKLGDRIKKYEKTFTHSALKRMPLMIRVDGRAFHTFTKNLIRPFDNGLISAMVKAATYTAKDMQGFRAAYIQSDEATFLLTDYESFETEGWFDYELPKVISISAALMSVAFNHFYPTDKLPVFDSRAFTIPKEDVVNAFVWRAKDWERNSIQMYTRSFFSHEQLHQKNREDMHEMLHSVGKNWATDLSSQERNGTFLIKTDAEIIERTDILPTYVSINAAIGTTV